MYFRNIVVASDMILPPEDVPKSALFVFSRAFCFCKIFCFDAFVSDDLARTLQEIGARALLLADYRNRKTASRYNYGS